MNSKNQIKSAMKLDQEKVFCIACRCIYIEPVTMPCGHTLCLECFKNMVNMTAYQCPICRKRISNWLRKFKNDWSSMIDVTLWEAVQQQFPVQVKKKLNGEDDGLDEIIVGQSCVRVENQKGEIKKEFEDQKTSYQQDQEKILLQDLELAQKLQAEEERNSQALRILNENVTKDDARLALLVQEELQNGRQKKTFSELNLHLSSKLQDDEKLAMVIQEKLDNETKQDQLLLYESDLNMARQVQAEFQKTTKNSKSITISSKNVSPKKGPLDYIFSKVQNRNKENNYSSNYSSSSSTLDEFSFPSTSSLGYSDSSIIFQTDNSSQLVVEKNLNIRERLKKINSNTSSQFDVAGTCYVDDDTMTQLKTDYLLAKELDTKFRRENFENYNLRRRPYQSNSSKRKKTTIKLSKGQTKLKF